LTISLETLNFLKSDTGANWLEKLALEDLSDRQTLRLLTLLRRELSPAAAGAVLEMARLRLKAVDKFGEHASKLFFTREALEQASDPYLRKYRAERIVGTRPALSLQMIDACCGIGADSLAFAAAGGEVLGLDIDPVRVAIAQHNAVALGMDKARFQVADVRDDLPHTPDVMFYDPARRDDQGRRIHDVEAYNPPLSLVKRWDVPLIASKLSPGVDLEQLKAYPGGMEFISVDGDLKEAVLWLGQGVISGLGATLISGGEVYQWQAGDTEIAVPFSRPRGWLVEPDPALLRAGLVQDAALKFDGFMLDATIAYFTTDTKPESAWVRAWEILDWMPFHLKKLRAYLRERQVGTVTVKKRGSAMTPETLIPQLKLKGMESCTLVLTRCQGQPIVLICRDLPA
jgi:predicted RNA methylase